MKTFLLCLFLASASLAGAVEFAPPDGIENLYPAVTAKDTPPNEAAKRIRAEVASSRVPTSEQAAKLALQAFVTKPGLDARDAWGVSGLYRLGRDVPDFGKTGDLFWEVRVSRSDNGVSGVIWVCAATGASRVLFP